MRNCEDFALLASLAVDGEASEVELAELTAHLEACPACRAYFEDVRAIHDAFSLESIVLPADFAAGVMDRVRETPQEQPEKSIPLPRRRRWVPGAVLAACCALAALGVWRLGATQIASRSMVAADCAAQSGEENAAPAEARPEEKAEMALELDAAPPRSDAKAPPAADVVPQPDGEPAEGSDAGEPVPAEAPAGAGEPTDAPAAPAPATVSPQIRVQGAEGGTIAPEAAGETLMLTTASPEAGAWVEERLGLPWTGGEVYRLTEEAYRELRAALAEAGEEFSEEVLGTSGGVWLVKAR